MTRGITFVGMDVRKVSINVAVLEPGKNEYVEWKVDNRVTLSGAGCARRAPRAVLWTRRRTW